MSTATETQPASTRAPGIVLGISGWGVLSGFGVGAEEFIAGWTGGASALTDVEGMFPEPLPVTEAAVLRDFTVRDHLGRKGTSFYDRTTSLTVVACGLALADSDAVVDDTTRGKVGVALGSTTGGVQSLSDFIKETVVNDPPYLVNPILFPFAVMNAAASSAAIWHQLKGVNATISDGQVSFVAALRYARNKIRHGYADAMLAGAVEEFTPQRAWASEHTRGGQAGRVPLGEGAALFVLEDAAAAGPDRRRWRGEILAAEVGLFGPPGEDPDPGEGLATVIGRALAVAGVDPAEVRTVAPSLAGSARRDEAERRGILAALGGEPERWLPVKQRLGETYSASGALQLAAILAEHGSDPALDGAVSLLTSMTSDGLVGVAVVRGWNRVDGTDRV